MTITVPDHDTLIKHIKTQVVKAVHQEGWPYLRTICEEYGVSASVLRKIYLWDPRDNESFNFQKLINAYDLAYDVVQGLRVKKSA